MRKTTAKTTKAPPGGSTALPHSTSVGSGYGGSRPAPAALSRSKPAMTRKANNPKANPKRRRASKRSY